MSKRIKGIDVSRAIAVFGMIIVNFKVVFGNNGSGWLKTLSGLLEGKAAATFVVLAGVGLALMSNGSIKTNNRQKIKNIRSRIFKKALFLFFVGLSYISIWPADILHFYGIYMLLTLLLLTSKETLIFLTALITILAYPLLMFFIDYDQGWSFSSLNYVDFWNVNGFVRNLLYNGFHPVFPWVSFMLIGLWFGKQDLHNKIFLKRSLWVSLTVFGLTQLLSFLSIELISEGNIHLKQDLTEIIGTNPMPPLPFYMISGSSIAIFVISTCIVLANKFESSKIIDALYKTGQLALTFYAAHVIIGMGIIETLNPKKMGTYSIEFSVMYAIAFSLSCILFAFFWKKHRSAGPLEWIMRKMTD